MAKGQKPGTPEEYRELYTKLAKKYDMSTNSFVLLGARVKSYRRKAVGALELEPGSTVLDLACGTGLNFPYLEKEIGDKGRIVGVDITPAMLNKANEKIIKYGWKNIELLEQDANQLEINQTFDGAICCHALSLMPGYKEVVQRLANMLKIGGRLVIMDMHKNIGAFKFMNEVMAWLTRPFYIGDKKEGPSHKSYLVMNEILSDVEVQTYYFDQIYIASGTRI